jgi:hypothetical protein
MLVTTVKRVTETGAGARYALRNASDKEARSWEPKKTSASSPPFPPLTLASPVNHQCCFRPPHVFELASFSRRPFRPHIGAGRFLSLESGKGWSRNPTPGLAFHTSGAECRSEIAFAMQIRRAGLSFSRRGREFGWSKR